MTPARHGLAGLLLLAPSTGLAAEPAPSAVPSASYPSPAPPPEPAPPAPAGPSDRSSDAPPAPANPPAPEPPAPQPGGQAAPEPPPQPVAPPVTPTVYPAPLAIPEQATPEAPEPRRSRLFASFGIGPGLFRATSGSPDDRRSFRGGSVSGRLALGAQLTRVAVGGAFYYDHVYDLSSEDEVVDLDEPTLDGRRFSFSGLALFTDVALADDGGLHFEFSFGFGGLSTSRAGSVDDPDGLALGAGAGYDFAVGERTALGAVLRVTYAPLSVNEGSGGTEVETFIPALLLTGTVR